MNLRPNSFRRAALIAGLALLAAAPARASHALAGLGALYEALLTGLILLGALLVGGILTVVLRRKRGVWSVVLGVVNAMAALLLLLLP